jgi:hypothetical protein
MRIGSTEGPRLLVDMTPLSCFHKIQCIPTEQIEIKTLISIEKAEIMVPSKACVERYEPGGVVSRTWAKCCKQEKQCFPKIEDGDKLCDPSLPTKAKRVHCPAIGVVVVDGRGRDATLSLGER